MDDRVLILTPDEPLANRLGIRFRNHAADEVAHFTDAEDFALTSHLNLSAYTVMIVDERFFRDFDSTCRFIRDLRKKNEHPIIGLARSNNPLRMTFLSTAGCNFCILDAGSDNETTKRITDLKDEIDGAAIHLFA